MGGPDWNNYDPFPFLHFDFLQTTKYQAKRRESIKNVLETKSERKHPKIVPQGLASMTHNGKLSC